MFNSRVVLLNEKTGLNYLHGAIYAAMVSLCAELALAGFQPSSDYLSGLGRVIVVFLSLYTLHRFACLGLTSFKTNWKDLSSLVLLLLGAIVLLFAGEIIARSLASYASASKNFKNLHISSIYYAIPFASGAMLLQVVLGLHYSLIFALSLALIVGVYFPSDFILVPYVITTSLVACFSLLRFRSRSAYIRAGINVALVSVPFAMAGMFIAESVPLADIFLRASASIIGGLLCVFVGAGLTPIFEYMGGYVTDMRLIEMATLDHPLLKELSVQAPGTWNHSMVMGMMVESAADAVGANATLARVGAYFHDVGKIKKPLYFVENQMSGDNRHDKLSTSMSALIIRSHVKDGIELARKHKLPKLIEDMIPQHHGTALIEYFYDKACKEADEVGSGVEVDRSLYSYPGPKPQTREAGILMLADGIEAAARTLNEPGLDRIQGMVQKLINKVFASGELDESELTLKDLHQIAKCFTRVLNGIYHQRIAYAEPVEKTNVKEPEAEELIDNASESAENKPGSKVVKEGNKEDLKRLGL